MSFGSLTSMLAVSTLLTSSPGVGVTQVEAPHIESQTADTESQEESEYREIDFSSLGVDAGKKTKVVVDVSSQAETQRISDVLNTPASSHASSSSITSENPQGVDIASHQHTKGSIDISSAVRGNNLSYMFIKATEGTHYTNPYFHNDSVEAINTGIAVGFYHYAKPTGSTEEAKEQARHFVATTGIDRGVRSLPPVLDIEENKNHLSAEQLIAWTQAFVDEVKNLSGKTVMIYTYPSFWRGEMGNTTQFSSHPLWIAHYHNGDTPDVPGGWTNWTFWQYTSKGNVSGYSGDIDMNYFNGSESSLKSIYE